MILWCLLSQSTCGESADASWIYKIISETEKALKIKYPYYTEYCGKIIAQKYKTLWIPKSVINKGEVSIKKFFENKMDSDIKKLPLVFQREQITWYSGLAPKN